MGTYMPSGRASTSVSIQRCGATPTIDRQGPASAPRQTRTRRPIGELPGKNARANGSFTSATGSVVSSSLASKLRPPITGRSKVRKKPGVTKSA